MPKIDATELFLFVYFSELLNLIKLKLDRIFLGSTNGLLTFFRSCLKLTENKFFAS